MCWVARGSKGTYIRALVADLGEGLGSLAHMTSLVRTASGTHQLEDAWQVRQGGRRLAGGGGTGGIRGMTEEEGAGTGTHMHL